MPDIHSRETYRDAVIRVVSSELCQSPQEIREEDSWDKLGADSLDKLAIVEGVEQCFGGLHIPEKDLDGIQTPRQLVDYLVSH